MQKILLATDGSEYSLESLKKVVPMIKKLEAHLTLLSVAEEVPSIRGTEGLSKNETELLVNSINQEVEEGLERARNMFEAEGIKVETMKKAGKPAEMICNVASSGGFELVILGDTGRGGLSELFLGSVSNKVVHQCKAHVMIVKRDY